jgi:transcriptional regulator with PAS, ATPase and Fis domain
MALVGRLPFTGAHKDKDGLFVAAAGGTICLDELGEMSPGMQVKLLRVLQEREVTKVGSTARVLVDARIVCATNRRLRDEVAFGRFREDLYYRLGVVTIHVPPLRDRIDDLPELVERILRSAAETFGRPVPRLAPAARRLLLAHRWPGNVRELENVLTKAVLMADGGVLGAADVDPSGAPGAPVVPASRAAFRGEEAERMLAVLRACKWNVSEACRTLGMSRATLYRRLKRAGVSPEREGAAR